MFAQRLVEWDVALRAWMHSLGPAMEGVLQLCFAIVAGGLIGIEREVRGRQAGFRTNLLVCLGSTLVMIVSTRFASQPWNHAPGVTVTVDPARIAYGVMTGIGFLGAGAIIHNKGSVRGLTTAAGLWCVAAIGLSIGFGQYLISATGTLLVLISLWVLDYVEAMLPRVRYRNVTVRTPYRSAVVKETVERFQRAGLKVLDASLERNIATLDFAEVRLSIAFVSSQQYYTFERLLEEDPTYQVLATREV